MASPILANLFLHYAFDLWVTRHLPGVRFARYADDAVLHCKSRRQAEYVLHRIRDRFRACKLELHPGLARRWLALDAEIKAHDRHLEELTQECAPTMIEAHGMAAGTAAEMLLLGGDNPDRIRSEAAFAKLCGACPIPASSGKTNRHRLNRGGNRQANAALYRVVIVRMRGHQPTIDDVRRRTAEGKSKREIIRCLKRFVAREIFGYLCGQPKSPLLAQSNP